jgi:hypothetical protein
MEGCPNKEPRSKRILVTNSDEVTMLDNLIGTWHLLVIELTGADAILATEEVQRSSGDDEVGLE